MKKILLAVALVSTCVAANAQEDYAPKAGSFSTELQFNPFSGNDVFSNSVMDEKGAVFSGAYFCTDKLAVTFDLGLGGNNKKSPVYDADGKEVAYSSNYDGTFILGLGAKYFFYNYKRVNLYTGAKFYYVHQFAGNKEVTDKANDFYTWNNQGTGNGFGIYALTGINFSIYKGLYVGAEINVGFKDVVYTGATFKTKSASGTTSNKDKVGGHDFNGGFGVNPMFLIGWSF